MNKYGTPGVRISAERRQRIKDALESALRDGYAPSFVEEKGKGSVISEAVRRLKETGHPEPRRRLELSIEVETKARDRGEEYFLPDWDLYSAPGLAPAQVRRGKVARWILTAAQDDTDIHMGFFNNLRAYAGAIGAELVVAGFTYQTMVHTDRMALTDTYRAELKPFLRFEPMDCGPVIFFANVNTLPTAVRPLSGMASMSRGRDAVFPHAKLAYETVPQPRGDYVPSIMTTGAVTVPNYIRKKAGLKAEFHHVLGATLVEVDGEGRAWCRPISATPEGDFQDLGTVVRAGQISRGNRIMAFTPGDIHCPSVQAEVFDNLWGSGDQSLINELRPKYQFFHDLMSFEMASRHVDKDPLHRAMMVQNGTSGIEWQVQTGAKFLRAAERDFCQSVVIKSNHDDRLVQWMKKPIDRNDIENVRYWHACNLAALDAISAGDADFDLVRWALMGADSRRLEGIDFVPYGGSFKICQQHGGGIECGMHGHEGANGTRGTAAGLAKMGSKVTIGDKHSPAIVDGVFVAGMTGDLDQGYNMGPGSWRRAHVLTYPNGKRTLVTQSPCGKWRA